MSCVTAAPRALMFGWIFLAAVISGCDLGKSTPAGPPPAAAPSETNSVALILPAGGILELESWENLARRQESIARTIVEVYRQAPGDPPSKQADLIKEAVDKGATALLVVAEDSPAVAAALKEARDEKNVTVVLMDRQVPVAGKPFPLVAYQSEQEIARELVAAAIEDAKSTGFPPGGPAILLTNSQADDHAKARAKALAEALKEANVFVLPTVTFAGMEDQAESAVRLALLTNPIVSMIFTDDELGLQGAVKVRYSLDHSQKRFVLMGYSAVKWIVDLAKSNVINAVVDRNISEPPAKAFGVVLASMRGETVPDVTTILTRISRASGPVDESRYSEFFAKPIKKELPKEFPKDAPSETPPTKPPA